MDCCVPEENLLEIERFCSENNLVLLFASVTGSRAMGLCSEDSDFDVRGVVVRKLSDYVTLDEPRRKIDSWAFERGKIDFQVWDIRKACSLLASSNQRALEMLFSPLVVVDNHGFGKKLKEKSQSCLSLSRLALHFVNDADMHFTRFISPQNNGLDQKKYIFLLRSIFAIRTILQEGTLPPINYAELIRRGNYDGSVPENVMDALKAVLDLKRKGMTQDQPRVPILENYYLSCDLASMAKKVPSSEDAGKSHFDELIARTIQEINSLDKK